jgi:hypothetical protein
MRAHSAIRAGFPWAFPLFMICLGNPLCGETPGLGTPSIGATPKGPDQINLTWPPLANAGYGYLVEIQSSADSRYASWTELSPMRTAGGFACDINVLHQGSRCNSSDPGGTYVYNPPNNGIPYWVAEEQYLDPQDNTPAQFIAWGLKPGATYNFRVRTYSGNSSPVRGAYSPVVSATTATYPVRYVSPQGKDSNDGSAPDPARAWRTISHGAGNLSCGQELVIMGGSYDNEAVTMDQKCTTSSKAVVWVNAGDTATIVSQPANAPFVLRVNGDHIVIDGLTVASSGTPEGQYDGEINGAFNALLNVEFHPQVVPAFDWGVVVHGARNLLYRCYLHDYGSPNPVQNPEGNGGFVLAVLGGVGNVVWSNHLTRGGHDESLCKSGCSSNRWLNNVMDGGWGHGWVNVLYSQHNLVEGNIIKGVGQMVSFYKPGIQLSESYNTVRRNIVINSRSWAIEISSLTAGTAADNLVYNNVFYSPGGCYFQSATRGVRSYFNDVVANNICYRVQSQATDIYLGNTTNRIVANSILAVGEGGKPQPDKPLIIWNRGPNGADPKPLSVADKSYPPFSRNKGLDMLPEFVDEANLDFHLSAGSPLIGAGVGIVDGEWGSTVGTPDLGAFGIRTAANLAAPPRGSDGSLEAVAAAARAGGLEAAVDWLQAHPMTPDAGPLAAVLARTAEADEETRAAVAHLATRGASSLMARFESVRQGREDPGLWKELAADPERVLDLADSYIYWGLDREALELLHGEHPPMAADHPLAVYYRAYCRDRLGYAYYAADDFREASGMPLKESATARPGTALVLQMALQRNPLDASAHYLLGAVLLNSGRTEAARSEFQNALKLRPAFAAASAALAKTGPPPESGSAGEAMLHPVAIAPAAGVKPVAAATEGTSPVEIADKALSSAAAGDLAGAQAYFTVRNFPQKKAEDSVREAYIELRLQRLLSQAAAKNCTAVEQGLTALGDDDRGLPFTFDGFGAFIKRLRFQYLLGVVEMTCGDQKEGRRQFEKVSKASIDLASPDYAYPYLALTRLSAAGAADKETAALEVVKKALDDPKSANRAVLLYSQGLLQLVLGKKEDAAASFRAGAQASSTGMLRYLNLDVLRTIDNPKF